MSSPYPGLTSAEVARRIKDGQVNRTPRSEWKAYAGIVARNVFTLFNALVTPAAVALFVLEKYQGAIAVSGMAIVNTTIGLVQEIKAKWHLDRLAILVETKVRVCRDGQVQEIPAANVVLGDLVLLTSGDAIVADGAVVDARFLEVDEALLTGESDPVRRQAGEPLLSGSFCVAGEGSYRADRVGAEAFAQRTSSQARSYHYTASPLTRIINLLIHILTYTAVGLCLVYVVMYWLERVSKDDMVLNMAATITSMVPQGLVLTATVSFTLAAVQMSRRGAIVQRLSAVESMASIDVICTDKTGTLTTNQLRLDQVRVVGEVDESEGNRLLALFAAASLDKGNKNLRALRAALGEPAVQALDQLPFKSQNRYSAVRIRDGIGERVLVLGACEALRAYMVGGNEVYGVKDLAGGVGSEDSTHPTTGATSRVGGVFGTHPVHPWLTAWQELLPTGLRLLLFAEATRWREFDGTLDGFELRPLLLVALSDELRPEAGQVLEALAAQGIAFKVISGDHPETVRATMRHINLPLAHEPVVNGDDLKAAADPAKLIAEHSVFGRVSPVQKVQIVQTLQRMGRHVAMIGDGINDVLPIKQADLGIAMGEGSQASKAVSSLVLENNKFALLPETLEEGRTILRNVRRSAKLFLVKNVYSFLLILAYASGMAIFPYAPQQVTLLNWLVIGIPAFAIALSRERSTAATKPRFLREVGGFAIRTGIIFACAGFVLVRLASGHLFLLSDKTLRTMLLSTLILLGVSAVLRALKDGEQQPLKGDSRFRWLAAAALPAYLAAMYVPLSAEFFQLTALSLVNWLGVLAVVVPAVGLTMLSDRLPLNREQHAAGGDQGTVGSGQRVQKEKPPSTP